MASLQPVTPDVTIEFFHKTRDIWEAMYRDCLEAKHSIEFEQYIVHNDENGVRFLKLFAEKARQGVKIRLLFDRIGSRAVYASPLVEEIRSHGGIVIFYHPIGLINLLAPFTWFPRNHTKAMLIDSQIAHIGSACLADYMREWRDLGARVTDPTLVSDIEKDFGALWKRGSPREEQAQMNDGGVFDYVVARPRFHAANPIYAELLAKIERAKSSILLATPYFLPPPRLHQALKRAVERGVNVSVMITEQTDVPLAVHVSQSYFEKHLKEGIRIFYFKGTIFHAKYGVIDDDWAMMGSMNIDYLSLLKNRESNIIIHHPETIADLTGYFAHDLKWCEEIHSGFWKRVPLRHKIHGYLGRLVKRML